MAEDPRHPGKLVGSKWSNVDPEVEYRHFAVIALHADGTAVLESVLEPRLTLRIAWRGLRERATWQPGWL